MKVSHSSVGNSGDASHKGYSGNTVNSDSPSQKKPKIVSPLKSIRLKCLDCSCYNRSEIQLCPIEDCPLYPYRMGHNPNRTGIGGNLRPAKTEIAKKTSAQQRILDKKEVPGEVLSIRTARRNPGGGRWLPSQNTGKG